MSCASLTCGGGELGLKRVHSQAVQIAVVRPHDLHILQSNDCKPIS